MDNFLETKVYLKLSVASPTIKSKNIFLNLVPSVITIRLTDNTNFENQLQGMIFFYYLSQNKIKVEILHSCNCLQLLNSKFVMPFC